jgi:hypothetical protein
MPFLLLDLGLGATEAQDTLRSGIVSVDGSPTAPVVDACLLVGYTTTTEVNNENVTFSGGGNYTACKQSIVAHVVETQHPCRWRHCAFNGVFQPKLTAGDLHLNKEFFELSAFVFTVRVRLASPRWTLSQLLVFLKCDERVCVMWHRCSFSE